MYTDNFGYSEVSGTFSMDNDTYDIEMSIPVSASSSETIYQNERNISVGDVTLVAITDSIATPEIISYQFELEELDTEDDLFTIRLLNLYQDNEDISVYISLEDESFVDANLVGTLGFGDLSDATYYETDDYKFYLTNGAGDLVFESDEVAFSYTNQQVMIIKQNPNSGSEGYQIDRISTSSNVTHIGNIESGSQLRVFNAMDENDLLTTYHEEFDLHLGGISDTPLVSNLNRHSFSDIYDVDAGDYSMDITDPASEVKLTNSQILSLPSGSNKSVFFYLTEVIEEDDDDEDTVEETELFVNSVVTDNNPVEGLYHHEVQVINFVEDYDFLTLYFVPSGESISTTSYKVINARAVSSTINLPNDDYDIFVLATENSTEILLRQTQLVLNEDSKNMYLVIEQEDAEVDDFIITHIPQN
jgi:hypothetical protein